MSSKGLCDPVDKLLWRKEPRAGEPFLRLPSRILNPVPRQSTRGHVLLGSDGKRAQQPCCKERQPMMARVIPGTQLPCLVGADTPNAPSHCTAPKAMPRQRDRGEGGREIYLGKTTWYESASGNSEEDRLRS